MSAVTGSAVAEDHQPSISDSVAVFVRRIAAALARLTRNSPRNDLPMANAAHTNGRVGSSRASTWTAADLASSEDDFEFDYVHTAELRSSMIAEILESPDVDDLTKRRLAESAAQSRRHLESIGEYEAASRYDAVRATTETVV